MELDKEFEKVIPDTDSKLGPVVYQKNENCQVFNGAMSGCVFAMPGATVNNNPTQSVASTTAEAPQSGGMKPAPANGRMAPITREMVRDAVLHTLDVRDQKGNRLFCRVYHWQSIHRILADAEFCMEMTETAALIKALFPDSGLPADCGKLYLKDVSAFGKYNAGAYAAPFSAWSREDRLGYPDPRYLIAEAFKEKLDALRREAFAAKR